MIVLGVDIGSQGALSALTEAGELLEIFDMPTLRAGPNGRQEIDPALLLEIIAQSHAKRGFIEYVGPRPGEGSVQSFSFGRAKGQVETACAANGVSITWLTPPVWKRTVGVPPGTNKDAARSEAIWRWPAKAALFARVKDHGRAESALIGVAGLLRERRP
jgi:crossover junction endodeoxyribonuclease RuvC